MSSELAARIDAELPQTQCTRCGYPACRPYAEAIARGEAEINRCPPGGRDGISRLARVVGREPMALDPTCGAEEALAVAFIDPTLCIGCTLCIQACPVDAIVGAGKAMHAVLPGWCTGCRLCIEPCPVDCISMEAAGRCWSGDDATWARDRFQAHQVRIVRDEQARRARLDGKGEAKLASLAVDPGFTPDERERKVAAVAAALARARDRRATRASGPTR